MMEKTVIVAAGGLVLNEQEELLMIYRRGKWDLPKGKLDAGETIEACALREVMEETGLQQVSLGSLIDTGHHDYFDQHLQQEVTKETHWFEMRATGDQELTPQTEEDITDIRWVKGTELEACLQDSYRNIIDIVQKSGLL